MSPVAWGGRRGQRAAAIATVVLATIGAGYGVKVITDSGGTGSATFSGTFDCYGTSQSCYTPDACTGGAYTLTSGANVLTSITAAPAGTVICLGSGSYSGFTASGVSKASDVVVQPSPGASATITSAVTIRTSSHLKFQGLNMAGATLGEPTGVGQGGAQIGQYITFNHVRFTAGVTVVNRAAAPAVHLLINGSTFDDLDTARWEGRLSFDCNWESCNTNPDIVVSNSRFANLNATSDANNNCSDGIGSSADAYGITVGPGNEFYGLEEQSCVAHVDPIQPYASGGGWLITGNYFHDNGDGSGGILNSDGTPNITVSNNVFVCSCVYPWSILSSGDGWTITHNTVAGGGAIAVIFNNGNTPSGNTVRDNAWVAGGGLNMDSGGGTNSYNLNSGVSGTGNVTGTAVLQSSPASGYYHYQLASSSPGYHAASDGRSMGIAEGG